MKLTGGLAALLLVASAAAQSSSSSSTTSSPTTTVPSRTTSAVSTSDSVPTAACGKVSSLWQIASASSAAAPRGATVPTPTVSAELAWECLNSIPLDKPAALDLVASLRPYVEWQSNLAYLADPPEGYLFPPFNITGHLDTIVARLNADEYENEIQFQQDLYQITTKVHDGHFVFYPDALTRVFDFGRTMGLVTYSETPTSQPIIKLFADVDSNPDTAPVVAKINGIDAAKFVTDLSNSATGSQDPDAGYNQMFFSRAIVAAGSPQGLFRQGGRHRFFYPGPNTTITYADGKNVTTENYAAIKVSMRNVTDGTSFYRRFCNPRVADASAEAPIAQTPPTVRKPGYPSPVLQSNDSVITGYYLDGEGYENVAVLFVSGFDPDSPPLFQRAVDYFINLCRQDGKTKIIIDLQMNGGGYIFQGYDLYRQFFPTVPEEGYNRWRENPQFMALAEIISEAVADVDPYTDSDRDLVNLWESWWNYRYDLNETGGKFPTFEDKFAPRKWKGDPYTAVLQWDMNDSLTTSNSTFGLGIQVTGYQNRTNYTQPFKVEDIVLLTDGYCASTCSLFSTFMKWNAGVKSIVFGGRPGTHQMNAVGGVKGAQVLSYGSIYNTSMEIIRDPLTRHYVNESQRDALMQLSTLPTNRSTNARINVRDQILPGNLKDGIPAQFIYEPADCRLFFTLDMHIDVRNIWKAAADSAFFGKPCVSGTGFGKKSSGGMVKREKLTAEQKLVAERAAQRGTMVVTALDVPEARDVDPEKLRKWNQRVVVM